MRLSFVSGRTDRAPVAAILQVPRLHAPKPLAGVSPGAAAPVRAYCRAASFHEPHGPAPFHAIQSVDNFVSIENGY